MQNDILILYLKVVNNCSYSYRLECKYAHCETVSRAARNQNCQPWKVVMAWCIGSSCVSLWGGRCAISNRKKEEEKNMKDEYTGSCADINMEWSRVQNTWNKWSDESFRFSPTERFVPITPPLCVHYHCVLHSDATLLLSHLSPLAPEEEEKQSNLCVSQRA